MVFACAGVVLAQQTESDPSRSSSSSSAKDFVDGEILVKFNTGVSEQEQAEIHRRNAGQLKKTIRGIDVKVIKVAQGRERALVDRYKRTPKVEFAELNGIVTAANDPDDPYDNTSSYASAKHGNVMQWGWKKIQAYEAWDQTTGSSTSPVKVAVADTGIDTSHPDLPAVAAANQWNFVNETNNAEDNHGHGTHVAGTIGAKTNNTTGVAGANWNVDLMAAKVLNSSGTGSFSDVADGITWAANNGAKVINLSLGGSASATAETAVNYAWNKGAVLACAAGNGGTSTQHYPAAYTKCIAVAATDENDQKASFSNYGNSWVDVAAPGVHILSTMPDTPQTLNDEKNGFKTTYDSLNGTSMATPHVAGLAGLVTAKGTCNDKTGSELALCVRNEIESKADRISGTGTYWAKGRINTNISVGGTPPPPDKTAPETTIDSGPSETENSGTGTATFTFSASESGSTFECRLDSGVWVACTSPQQYTGLPNGSHTFEVRATDSASNVDPSPASHTWTIDDTTPPETTITSGPSDGSTTGSTTSFHFSTSEDGSTFQCNLDGIGWESCIPPKKYTNLSSGSHTFEVRAEDVAGNTSTPASRTWTVDATIPVPKTCASGSTADNPCDGTEGLDNITGTSSDDYIRGLGGRDKIDGRYGDDTILGGDGDDTIYGGYNRDKLLGEEGDDTIYGGYNRDEIDGGKGVDTIWGENDADTIWAADDGSNDIINCGGGDDTVTADYEDTVSNCEYITRRPPRPSP
jgi:thermitase